MTCIFMEQRLKDHYLYGRKSSKEKDAQNVSVILLEHKLFCLKHKYLFELIQLTSIIASTHDNYS